MIENDEHVVKKSNIKKFLIIFVLFVFFLIIVADTVMILQLSFNKSDQIIQDISKKQNIKYIPQTKTEADSIKTQAIQAANNNEEEKASRLLQQAQEKYKSIKDNEGIADTDSQLYLLNNQSDPKTKDIITINAGQ